MCKRNILFLLLSCFCLSGCTKSDEAYTLSGNTVPLEIPVGDTESYRFEIPTEFVTVETDNNVYWKFSDGTTIYLTQLINHTASEYDESLGIYTSDLTAVIDFEEYSKSICITTDTSYCSTIAEYLADGEIVEKDINLYVENELDELPTYVDMSDAMALSENNLYMPEAVQESAVGIYTADLYCDGTYWLESWIMDGTYDDIINKLTNICLNNSNVEYVDKWFYDDTHLLLFAGDNVLGAKKLRYNEWYIYYGSHNYFDHIMTGIEKVHSSGR